MTLTVPLIESLTLNVSLETHVKASLEATFEALLEQIGPGHETPDSKPLPMTLEAWPGGRWLRDLGEGNGHFWGHVQAIKRPTLLEITGPLFMSTAVLSNVQYRLKAVDGGTLLSFRHTAFGFVPEEHKAGLVQGWTPLIDRIRARAEGVAKTH